MSDLDRAKDKIRKCLALSKSPEAHEAAAALRQAQKLMAMHGISEDDIDAHPQGDASVNATTSKRHQPWEGILAAALAKTFGIGVHRAGGTRRTKFGRVSEQARYVYYGDAARVELATHAHAILVRAAQKARTAYVREFKALNGIAPVSVGRSFIRGYVTEVYVAAVPLLPTPREQRALDEYRVRKGLVTRRASRTRVDTDHFASGQAAGRQHGGLNVPVNGGASSARLSFR
ncbi:MAG: hypothetical protein RIS35_2461 [Pseudomonadota bacterium]|jgi:hypothetical protein